jgi:glycosyltransferase involved in cell wall biosynthesis
MKITYVTSYDAQNIEAWSGTGYFIINMLSRFAEVECVGNTLPPHPRSETLKRSLYKRLLGKRYLLHYKDYISRHIAREVEKRISPDSDIVLSPEYLALPYLKRDRKIVLYTDATFRNLKDFYPFYSNLSWESAASAEKLQRKAFKNADLLVSSSEWSLKSMIDDYGVPREKVEMIEYGANLDQVPGHDEVAERVQNRDSDVCNLLFIGKNWARKGGPTAVKVTETMNDMGLKTILHVVGAPESVTGPLPSFVRNHGYVNKNELGGRRLLKDLLLSSHFLISPTLAECSPIAFAEANAYGLPVLSTNVGGTRTMVKDDVNGKLFELGDSPKKYATYASEVLNDSSVYHELCLNARREYEERLNWDVTGRKFEALLTRLLEKR